jgi:hypothetical protein
MEIKTVTERKFDEPVICANCGKKLPVEIVEVESSATVAAFCKHCKTVTVVHILNN